MLHAVLQELRRRFPSSQFQLLSIYPEADHRRNQEGDLQVISSPPLWLLGWYMPLTVIAAVSKPSQRFLASRLPFFRAIAEADAIIDLSGIAFVDGRGLPLLWYNISCALPGIIWRKPVFKLSQALGPFKKAVNRLAAKFVLRRCALVIPRGARSFQFLKDIGMQSSSALPDVSFALDIPFDIQRKAERIIQQLDESDLPWVIVSPSRVVARLCDKRGIDFLEQMSQFVNEILRERTFNILILPHSLGTGNSKNNDINLCQSLYQRLKKNEHVFLHIADDDPVLLRAIIGQASFFVGCRFHAVVAALSMSVPTLILGWSHKYREMADAFDAEIPSLDFSSLSATALTVEFRNAWRKRHDTHARLKLNGPSVKALASCNFDLLEAYIRQSHACN